jgi:hypothetical protein
MPGKDIEGWLGEVRRGETSPGDREAVPKSARELMNERAQCERETSCRPGLIACNLRHHDEVASLSLAWMGRD